MTSSCSAPPKKLRSFFPTVIRPIFKKIGLGTMFPVQLKCLDRSRRPFIHKHIQTCRKLTQTCKANLLECRLVTPSSWQVPTTRIFRTFYKLWKKCPAWLWATLPPHARQIQTNVRETRIISNKYQKHVLNMSADICLTFSGP